MDQAYNILSTLQQTELAQEVWSEIATIAHPTKAPAPVGRTSWEHILADKMLVNPQGFTTTDLMLAFSGLAILVEKAAQSHSHSNQEIGGADATSIRKFVDVHMGNPNFAY